MNAWRYADTRAEQEQDSREEVTADSIVDGWMRIDVLAVMDDFINCYESVEECPDDTAFLAHAREARAAVAELVDRAQHLVICHSNGVLIERDVEDLRAALSRVTGGAS